MRHLDHCLQKIKSLLEERCEGVPLVAPPVEEETTFGEETCPKDKFLIAVQGWDNRADFRDFPDQAHFIAEHLRVSAEDRVILRVPRGSDILDAISRVTPGECGTLLYLERR